MTQFAAERGVVLAPSSLSRLFKQRGRSGTRRYINDLGTIMDAAATFGIDCTQARATRRIAQAGGSAHCVIADFAAQHRRRSDRRTATCCVTVPPHALRERANAFAGCGCPRCCERLSAHMKPYIAKMISAPYFAHLDPDEARSEANLALIRSAETWPGGNFTGWFAAHFNTRVKEIYSSRSRTVEWDQPLSLDASSILDDDNGGRTVSLGERVSIYTADVLTIVIRRAQLAEAALAQRKRCIERVEEYDTGGRDAPMPSQSTRLRRVTFASTTSDTSQPRHLSISSQQAA